MTTAAQPSKWFLAQWLLMREATRDKRMNAVDLAVLLEILDRRLDEFGNARASWTHLTRTTGRVRSAVAASAAKLVDLGYLTIVAPGLGTRATTYAPNWGFSPSEPSEQSTNSDPLPRPTWDLPEGALQPEPVLSSGSHIHLPQPPTGALTVKVDTSLPGAALPPPPPTLRAGAAFPPGFEELFECYGYRAEFKKAATAYQNLSPDAELHSLMLTAAKRWRGVYDEEQRPLKYRFMLHNWIADGRYNEDGPMPYDPRGKAERHGPKPHHVAARPPVAPSDRARIIAASREDDDVRVDFETEDGERFFRVFDIRTPQSFKALIRACRLGTVKDTSDLLGSEVIVTGNRWHAPVFTPAPANDNQPQGGATADAVA